MDNLMKSVGEHIRSYRKQQGLTQEELAFRAGLHATFIGKIERAEKVCTVESLSKVLVALGIPMDEFFRHIQLSNSQNRTFLSQIINLIQQLSIIEQRKILEIIKIMYFDE